MARNRDVKVLARRAAPLQTSSGILGSDRRPEARGCQSVRAYRATVVMCRRALQSSCQDLNAEGAKLRNQIDDLAGKGVITRALKDLAHQIRKIGNTGAHPDEDGLEDVNEADAEDIVEFTEQYFRHVYVLPAQMEELKKRRQPKPESAAARSTGATAGSTSAGPPKQAGH